MNKQAHETEENYKTPVNEEEMMLMEAEEEEVGEIIERKNKGRVLSRKTSALACPTRAMKATTTTKKKSPRTFSSTVEISAEEEGEEVEEEINDSSPDESMNFSHDKSKKSARPQSWQKTSSSSNNYDESTETSASNPSKTISYPSEKLNKKSVYMNAEWNSSKPNLPKSSSWVSTATTASAAKKTTTPVYNSQKSNSTSYGEMNVQMMNRPKALQQYQQRKTLKIGIVQNKNSKHYGLMAQWETDVNGGIVPNSWSLMDESTQQFLSHCSEITGISNSTENMGKLYSYKIDDITGLKVGGTFRWLKE